MTTREGGKRYRFKYALADGRMVYMSKRGCIHVLASGEAEAALARYRGNRDASGDPMVYAADLSAYGNRSLFLGVLAPFVMTVGAELEDAATPVDPAAWVLGAHRATAVGTFSRAGS